MVVNVEKLLKMVENGDFSKFVKNGEMLKNVGDNIKTNFALIILKILFLTKRYYFAISIYLYSFIAEIFLNEMNLYYRP